MPYVNTKGELPDSGKILDTARFTPTKPSLFLNQMILDRIMRQFRVMPQLHLLQQARPIHADGLDRQSQFEGDIADSLAGSDHGQGLELAIGQGFVQGHLAVVTDLIR